MPTRYCLLDTVQGIVHKKSVRDMVTPHIHTRLINALQINPVPYLFMRLVKDIIKTFRSIR